MTDAVIATRPFPKGAVRAAGVLIVLALTAAGAGRYAGIGTLTLAPAAPVASLDLRFTDRADGAVTVSSAPDDREIAVLAPGTNGFVRGVLRGLARDRHSRGIGADVPFRLVRRVDGRLSLEDPATGRAIDLGAFGPTNVEAFGRLLQAQGGKS
jgi:putative photosynthetic complex assembly protein